MGVTCQILVNKMPGGIYRPGQAVTGIVKYNIDKRTEYKTVTLSLLGTGKCAWNGYDKYYLRKRPHYGNEHYVTILIMLLNNKRTLEAGAYEYPFKFELPDNLPSSYEDEVCKISYKIQLKFEKPDFFTINKTFRTAITVQGYIEPKEEGPVVVGLEKIFKKLFSEKDMIKLKAEIAKTCVVPGESVHLTPVVTNNTKVTPVVVQSALYCYTKYTANCGGTKKSNKLVKECCADNTEIPTRGEVSISQVVPTSSSLYSITTKVMVKEYRLRVTVSFPAPHSSAMVEMPVVIGNRKGAPLEAYAEKEGTSASSMAPVEGGAPPSYWQAMSEVKDKK